MYKKDSVLVEYQLHMIKQYNAALQIPVQNWAVVAEA